LWRRAACRGVFQECVDPARDLTIIEAGGHFVLATYHREVIAVLKAALP
jgi:hypothetical protein